MAQNRTRKIVITGAMGALTILLGLTPLGFIPWFSGASITLMQVPVIIGAILEGPIVGAGIGLIMGIFSMIRALTGGPVDILFTNPLISILPRIFIGPAAWLIWRGLKKLPALGLIVSGFIGSATNTILVLGMIGIINKIPFTDLWVIVLANGVPEAIASALITLAVVGLVLKLKIGKKAGADL